MVSDFSSGPCFPTPHESFESAPPFFFTSFCMSAIQFSIDRPFGVYLWDYFDQLHTAVVGKSASDFAFVEGETPLSTVPEGKKAHAILTTCDEGIQYHVFVVTIGCVTYLLVIFGGQYMLRESGPSNPKFIFRLHNFLLTIVSLALLLLLVEQLVPQLARHGLYYTICSAEAWTEKHELLYYLNYLVKWWELADTVFLVLKKKKLGK